MTIDVLHDPAPGRLTGWGSDLIVAAQIAERVAGTEFVPTAMRGKPDVVVAAILYGAEVGVGPMQALNSIHVVEGRPFPSAELMRAMIQHAGHHLAVHEWTGTRVRVSGLRAGRPESERVYVDWTIDMGRAAGLLGRRNWQNYPRAMLMARATGDLARVLFADVVKGLGYAAEDTDSAVALDVWADGEASPGTATQPPRKALARARKPKAAPPAQPTPPETPPARDDHSPTPASVVPEEVPEPPDDVPDEAEDLGPLGPPPRDPYDPDDVALLPELQPESPAPEPPPVAPERGPVGPPIISAGPLRALHAALTRELGTVATREEKLAMLSAILGKPVESSKALTRADGYAALDYLGRVASGQAAWDMDPSTGAITLREVTAP